MKLFGCTILHALSALGELTAAVAAADSERGTIRGNILTNDSGINPSATASASSELQPQQPQPQPQPHQTRGGDKKNAVNPSPRRVLHETAAAATVAGSSLSPPTSILRELAQDEIIVCHRVVGSEGAIYEYKQIALSEWLSHKEHGDKEIGDAFPGKEGFIFGPDCAPTFPFDDSNIRWAVKFWRYRKEDATAQYGHISHWDTSGVTDMSDMFKENWGFNEDISRWDTSSVTDMSGMFYSASWFNQDISSWDVSSVTDMSNMFYNARAFNEDISSWDTSSVTDMSGMFMSTEVFNKDISSWDVSSVTNMGRMFWQANAFNQDISSWDVSSVIDMWGMFYAAFAFNGDISSWDVSSVTNMKYMFTWATAFNQNLCDWGVHMIDSDGSGLKLNVDGMFVSSACIIQDSPSVSDDGTVTPLCHSCI